MIQLSLLPFHLLTTFQYSFHLVIQLSFFNLHNDIYLIKENVWLSKTEIQYENQKRRNPYLRKKVMETFL